VTTPGDTPVAGDPSRRTLVPLPDAPLPVEGPGAEGGGAIPGETPTPEEPPTTPVEPPVQPEPSAPTGEPTGVGGEVAGAPVTDPASP
jgi:hypothetical protein